MSPYDYAGLLDLLAYKNLTDPRLEHSRRENQQAMTHNERLMAQGYRSKMQREMEKGRFLPMDSPVPSRRFGVDQGGPQGLSTRIWGDDAMLMDRQPSTRMPNAYREEDDEIWNYLMRLQMLRQMPFDGRV